MATHAHQLDFFISKKILTWSLFTALGFASNNTTSQTLGQQFLASSAQGATPIAATSAATNSFVTPTQSQLVSLEANGSGEPAGRTTSNYHPLNFDAVSILNNVAPLGYTPVKPILPKHQAIMGQTNIATGPAQNNTMVAQGSNLVVQLPEHIPVSCVTEAAQRYQVPEMALISIIRQESGGRHVIGSNNNGSRDYGPAQINDRTWGEYLQKNYSITLNDVLNNMCQAIMVQAYILRLAWNSCIARGNTDIWCGIANYHSPNPTHQKNYVAAVWKQHQYIVAQGRF